MQAVGEITACYQNILTGRLTPILHQKNLVLYEAADIMAAMLSGDMNSRISHMYFQYENTNSTEIAGDTIARESNRTALEAASAEIATRDWLRVPILSTPKLIRVPDNDTRYAANSVVFTATSGASDSMLGEKAIVPRNYFAASGANGPSQIFSVALVAAPVSNSGIRDKIFSRVNLTSPISARAGHQVTVFWLLKFN